MIQSNGFNSNFLDKEAISQQFPKETEPSDAKFGDDLLKVIKNTYRIPLYYLSISKMEKKYIVKLIKHFLYFSSDPESEQNKLTLFLYGYFRSVVEYFDSICEFIFTKAIRYELYRKPFIRFDQGVIDNLDQKKNSYYFELIDIIKQENIKYAKSYQLYHHQCKHLQHYFMTPADLKSSDPQKILVDHSKSECFGCVRQMKEGSLYFKNNQYYSLLNCYSNEELLTQKLKQKFVMLLNKGGGFLFIVHEEDAHVKGFKMVDNYSDVYEKFIRSRVSTWIFPGQFHYWVDKIQTEENQKKGILRIKVVPFKQFLNRTFFVSKKVDRSPSSFKLFVMDQTCEDHKQDILSLDNNHFYSRIVNNFEKAQKNFQAFKNFVTCSYKQISIMKYQLLSCFNINKYFGCDLQGQMQIAPEQKDEFSLLNPGTVSKDFQPISKFKNQSILIFGSEHGDSQIKFIDARMYQYKMLNFMYLKPYANYRQNSKKSIWFFSHEYPLETMLRVTKEVVTIKARFLAFISVTRFLSIAKRPFTDLQKFLKIFFQLFTRYPTYYWQKIENQALKCNYFFQFKNNKESIFAFIYLDNCRITSKFIKQMQFNKEASTSYLGEIPPL